MSLIPSLAPAWRPLPDAELERLQAGVQLPKGWVRVEGCVFRRTGLAVLCDAGHEEDGRRWLHVSLSRSDGAMPRWEDIVEVRRIFVPSHLSAYQVVPRPSEHYDAKARGHVPIGMGGLEVLHLWACLDGDVLPDFLRARGGVL